MPAPKRPNTAEATRVRLDKMRERRLQVMAETLREAGYLVTLPCPTCTTPDAWARPKGHPGQCRTHANPTGA